MTTPQKKTVRLDPSAIQRRASDPSASVWVAASAGTGKTKVLTDRVLRLMLSNAKPDEILCLTFTRTAAAEMSNRIREELSVWATCDDKTLSDKLTKLQGRKPDAGGMAAARRLFASFLDSAVPMKIQTIHSFAEDLLRRFPIETGIPPYYEIMDDQTALELLRESRAEVLNDIDKDRTSKLAKSVRMVTPEVSEDDLEMLIGELTYRRGQLLTLIDQKGGLEKTIEGVFDWLQVPQGADPKAMENDFYSDAGLNGDAPDLDALTMAADILAEGSPRELESAKMIKAFLLNPADRAEFFSAYADVFLTKDGAIRKRLTTKATAEAEDAMLAEAVRLRAGIDAIKNVNVARGTESILRFADEILKKYTEKKRANNFLDYDDLVYQSRLMMEQDNAAGWTLQKLPGNLKHILVDEAQDTNPDQWALVSAIVGEFFKDKAASKDHTIFVVGDEKQSIFSFQRADPEEFGRRKKFFETLVQKNGGTWRAVDLDIAFRSSPAITNATDAVFAEDAAADGLFFKDEAATRQVKHNPFRRGQAGVVEIHPLIEKGQPLPPNAWDPPIEVETVSDPSAEMADRIADQIKGWLDKGEMLESRKRPVNPADIMILVRRRSGFVDDMVRALQKRDIPVAGADRMSLSGQLVVKDLVALGDFLLFEKDDEKLACVLGSPLIGLDWKTMESLCINRPGTLWESLAAAAADPAAPKKVKAAHDYLSMLRQKLNGTRPYEFYESILTDPCPGGQKGSSALFGRLGFEAEDPLVEFLNAIERFEKSHVPTLQGFLSWLDAGEAEVKREISLNRDTPRVHIMTVHAAKGLEAPIVFLPDTTGIPADNIRARPKFLWPQEGRDVPLWVPRSDLENESFTAEREKAEVERDREYRRLLYVAMTRAADRLYVYGVTGGRALSEKSWYSLIKNGVTKNLADKIEEVDISADFNAAAANDNNPPPFGKIIRYKVAQTARAEDDGMKPVDHKKIAGIPAWARTAPKADADLPGKFRPSEYNAIAAKDYSAPSPLTSGSDSYFKTLGTVIHQLFEFLPALPAADRQTAAEKFLAKPAWKITPADQASTAVNVMKILNDPSFAALFGPASRPEVSISGLFDKNGQKQTMSGQIDRLVVEDNRVTIVDFKNSRKVPKNADEVQYKYIVQMAAYRLALQQVYPGREIKCALLYTRGAKMIELPTDKLDAAIAKVGLKPAAPKAP